MAYFKITYGVAGGYNDVETTVTVASNVDAASNEAYELACQVYDSYGIFDYEGAQEELGDDFSDETLNEMERGDRESWIDYSSVEITKEEYDNFEEE